MIKEAGGCCEQIYDVAECIKVEANLDSPVNIPFEFRDARKELVNMSTYAAILYVQEDKDVRHDEPVIGIYPYPPIPGIPIFMKPVFTQYGVPNVIAQLTADEILELGVGVWYFKVLAAAPNSEFFRLFEGELTIRN